MHVQTSQPLFTCCETQCLSPFPSPGRSLGEKNMTAARGASYSHVKLHGHMVTPGKGEQGGEEEEENCLRVAFLTGLGTAR